MNSLFNISSRNDIPFFLNDHNMRGTVVEIGVYQAEYASFFMSHWSGDMMYGIDPFLKHNKEDYDDFLNEVSQEYYDNLYNSVCAQFKCYNNYTLLRTTSEQAVTQFEDNSLDMVFVDGNHSYDHVMNDSRLWYPKIKTGGMLAYHDYILPSVSRVKYPWLTGVFFAVNNFMCEINFDPDNFHVCQNDSTVVYIKT